MAFIGIAGPIGVGKSTLTRDLAAHLGFKAYFEPVESNPYLEDFYEDMKRWGFTMQMHLLARRFAQHQELVWQRDSAVQDRTIYEDTVFARLLHEGGFIDDRDYETYLDHFHVMLRYLVYPDIIVYLRCTPEVAARRIRARAREAEREIPMTYLEELHLGYEAFAIEMRCHTVVVDIDWEEFVPVERVANLVLDAAEKRPFARSPHRV